MRSFHPSGKAVLAAGALAVTLAVAGTSGAIAGSLVTSQDIKNGTIQTKDLKNDAVTNGKIAAGAVDWDKSLSAAAKEQIQSFVSEGVPGPQGPRGPRGSEGAPGADGMGKVVFWDYFGLQEPDLGSGDGFGYELPPLHGQPIELDQPGDYLLTMRGITATDGGDLTDTLIFAGEPDDEFDLFFDSCIPSASLSTALSITTCSTTIPVSVQPGQTVELPIYAASVSGDSCGELTRAQARTACVPPLAAASVTVYQVSTTPTADPSLPLPCRTDLGRSLKNAGGRC
jgi:hypothetical protein